jgi:DNA-binding NtrC family response regulator
MTKIKILVLDDDQAIRDELGEFLMEKNFETHKASLPSEAMEILKENEIDIAIIDVKLPEKDGITALKEIRELFPDLEVIMISGHGDMEMVISAMRAGANDFFLKPFRSIDVENAIERTKRFLSISKELKEVKFNYELITKELKSKFKWEMIAESKAMKDVLNMVAKVAKADKTTVLITGESGTGKEMIASTIHYLSARKNFYFNAVNCSAIPDTLFESEFFGHKKGSFTDAVENKSGLFEVTNKGTLFLDEIGDLKYELQGKFLRVLEEGKITKIGSSKVIDIDVRVIAATNRDLRKMSDEDKFRLDLLHRLNSFVINLPPLRERREEIPALLEYYVQQFANQCNKKVSGIDRNTFQILSDYSYPGNIRELRNMIERAVILCDDDKLKLKHFQFNYGNTVLTSNSSNIAVNTNLNLAENERELIKAALLQTQNNKSQAAKILGIDRKRLLRKINFYSLNQK